MKDPPIAKPCPFCGEKLVYTEWEAQAIHGRPIMRYYKHPESLCYASGFEVTLDDVPAWNKRRCVT